MNEAELMQENQNRSQLLNKQNAEFYGNIVVYLRMRGKLKNNVQMETDLLDLLNDLLDAQANGQSAADYFGTAPAGVAKEMLQALPNDWHKIRRVALTGAGFYALLLCLPSLIIPSEPVDIGKLLIGLVGIGIFILALSWGLSRIVFAKHQWLAAGIIIVLCGGAGALIPMSFVSLNTPLKLTLSNPVAFIVIGACLLAAAFQFYVDRQKFRFLPIAVTFLFVEVILGILGILVRVPMTATWLNQDNHVLYFLIGDVMLIWLIPSAWMIWNLIQGIKANRNRQN
ncbi:hypothetical protein [Lacticaseibacillus porcinae]|uniref:hypothetical protein n=1 Tax=Lacticaseibacillus porcinae TaxID=1123687 RepID=UPI000F7B6951|nr:hypothetical protein [Lacticaseibacillus porcinae]